MKKRAFLRGLASVIGLAVMTLALEAVLFNFRALQSRGYAPVEGEAVFLPGIRDNADGTITVLSGDAGERGIEFLGLDAHIENAYVGLDTTDGSFAAFDVFFMSTDAGNALYLPHPSVTVVTAEPASRYIKMNLAGETPKMKLRLDALEGQTLRFDGVRFNVPRPMTFEPLRMAFIFCVLGFFFFIRGKGTLFAQTLEKGSAAQLAAALAVLLALIVFAQGLMLSNPLYVNPPWEQHNQYKWLAQSLSKGKAALEREVSPELRALENPYDPYARFTSGAEFDWDTAYYDGQYYCYFGPVPCVLFYLPFYLLTGYGLDNLWAMLLVTPLFMAGLFLFFYLLLKRYAPRTRYALYLLLSTAAALGGGLMFALRHPDFYAVPMMTGLMFTVWGLSLWLLSLRGGERLRRGALCMGSLCMALVAGCRPQLVFASGFALFFFAPYVRQRRARPGDWAAFWMPYVLVAAAMMAYNAARFSSPFDLGANYNLTNADMTALGMNWERAPIAIFASFFQPARLTTAFPYLLPSDVETAFQGTLVIDQMFGGLLFTSPILWMGMLCFLWRDKLRAKKLYGLCLYSLLSSVFLCAFDAMGAGLLYRYVLDFGLLAFVPAVLTTAAALEESGTSVPTRAYTLVRLACAATFLTALMMICVNDFAALSGANPALYQHIRMLIEFWH